MPSAISCALNSVPQVATVIDLLNQSLQPDDNVLPPLTRTHLDPLFSRLPDILPAAGPDDKIRHYAIIETAARDLFANLIATTSIQSPDFVKVWNLLDITAVLADAGYCDPALLFWLVEELLDSQTIDGCRKVFDFLESRRERSMTKNMKGTALVILRFCNELLRRLSRAQDTGFCGRVFIFMFQSFPLHDRSSVNLRGEYHVENVTTFEQEPTSNPDAIPERMDIDSSAVATNAGSDFQDDKEQKEAKPVGTPASTAKAVSFDSKNKSSPEKPLDTQALYPIFWSLQGHFSQPMTLFEQVEFTKFKSAMESTLVAFETIDKLQKTNKNIDESNIIPQKRKSPEAPEERDGTNYNPKYLTSRDLFELEIGDLDFRRHILIQALIILEFLLSLTPQAKAKLANIESKNKSVMYGEQILNDDDAKWTKSMRERITNYLQAGPDGAFFFRIVDSVLSRDKGWVRWKSEGCPAIMRSSVPPSEFHEAMENARRLATNKRLRPNPMGTLSTEFLQEEDSETAMNKLKDPAKWQLPELITFKDKIMGDQLDLDFANSEKEKSEIVERKASKTWRALRIARHSRMAALDKVDDWTNIDPIFQYQPDQADEEDGEDAEPKPEGLRPEDGRPIILSGPHGAGKSTLAAMLLERQPGVFAKVVRHTTRQPREGETNGKDFHFVDTKAFNTILDGDYFLEFVERGSVNYGTNRRTVEALVEDGKTPLILLDREGTQSAKDNGFQARVAFIAPPSDNDEALATRIRSKGPDSAEDADIQTQLQTAHEELAQSKTQTGTSELYEVIIANDAEDNAEAAYKALEVFIYGSDAPKAELEKDSVEAAGGSTENAAPDNIQDNANGVTSEAVGSEDIPMQDGAPASVPETGAPEVPAEAAPAAAETAEPATEAPPAGSGAE